MPPPTFPRLPLIAPALAALTWPRVAVEAYISRVAVEAYYFPAETLRDRGRARTLQTNIKEQGRNLLPVISECGKQQREVLKQLGRFVELHQDWKTQPAAGVVEEEVFQWGEVEGKSLKQLQDIAKCYINKLGL